MKVTLFVIMLLYLCSRVQSTSKSNYLVSFTDLKKWSSSAKQKYGINI